MLKEKKKEDWWTKKGRWRHKEETTGFRVGETKKGGMRTKERGREAREMGGSQRREQNRGGTSPCGWIDGKREE